MEYPHEPVLLHEVIQALITVPDGIYVDGTVGSGGHSEAIGRRISGEGRLICLDTDAFGVRLSGERLSFLGERVTVVRSSYSDLEFILKDQGLTGVDGILLDLGLSSYQLDQSGRGFSFTRNEPLDMRMDTEKGMTAGQLLMDLTPEALKKILKEFGEERKAGLIVKAIERERRKGKIDSSLKLAGLIQGVIPPSRRPKHPATRTFQALRIAVNNELGNLRSFLDSVPNLLKRGGQAGHLVLSLA
ncbi:MAG: 16S rRNA (cytosine(1402)-N(4))-methyltransferase RsmH [Pseudomonadota bacterium]